MNLKDLASAGAKEVKREGARAAGRAARRRGRPRRKLPVLKTWPEDGGPFITLPLVVTSNPQGPAQRRHVPPAGLRPEHDGHAHPRAPRRRARTCAQWKAAGVERVPVSVALGGDPVTIFSATAPVPPMIDEYLFSGILRGEPVEVVKCVTNDLLVPAHAEIVLEGYVRAGRDALGGAVRRPHRATTRSPTTSRSSTSRPSRCAATPIYPTTIVGPPPMEDCYIGKATERLFLPVIKAMMPEVVDYDLPLEGVFHNCAIFQIKKEFAGQAFRVMNFAWSMGQMMFTKFVIVVDEDVDCHDYSQVAWRCFNNVDPEPRHPHHARARSTGSTTRATSRASATRWASTPRSRCPRRATTASGPTRWRCRPRSRRASTRCGGSSACE